jgi:hypothetical protein
MDWYAGFYTVVMVAAAVSSKSLGLCIVASVALLAFFPDPVKGAFVSIFFIPLYVYSLFRS